MNELRNLTIIIPTYNRHRYVLRTMKYWSGKGPNVLVLDGSKLPIDPKSLESFDYNISYIHFPNCKNATERIEYGINHINTDYTMLHADDEFFLPSGLKDCINEIEKDDLGCCLGRCLQIEIRDNRLIASPWTPLHAPFGNYSLLDENPEERVIKHMFPYLCSTIYGVTKTHIWKNNWIFTENQNSNRVLEMIYEIISAFQGKSKVIDTISWIRSDENEPIHKELDAQGRIPPRAHEWWLNNDITQKHDLLNKTAERLNQIDPNKDIKDLNILIRNAMYVFSKSADLSFTIRDMADILSKSCNTQLVAEAVKAQYKIGVFNEQGLKAETPTLAEMADKWRNLGILSNQKEIRELEDLILKFHSK